MALDYEIRLKARDEATKVAKKVEGQFTSSMKGIRNSSLSVQSAMSTTRTEQGKWNTTLSGTNKQLLKNSKIIDKSSGEIRKVSKESRIFNAVTRKTGTVSKGARKGLSNLNKEYNFLDKSTTRSRKGIDSLTSSYSKMGNNITSTSQAQSTFRGFASESIKDVGKLAGVSKSYTQTLIDQVKYVPKWQRGLTSGMTAAKKGITGLGAAWRKMGLSFLALIGPLFLVGAAFRTLKDAADWVYQPFIKFEDALYELRKTADLSMKSMLDIGVAISELSLVVPIAADGLAQIAATAGRLGIKGKASIMAFTETIAKMSVATTLSADDAAKALAKIREAFGIPIEAVEYLGSVLNELENTSASTVEELVAGMKNIGASGKLLGITVDEAAALSATLISAGMAGERAGTRLRRTFTEIARKADEITEFMGEAGEEWRKALEEKPIKAILMYLEKLDKVESKVERTAIAHEHFGKVAGFSIATLTENYPKLIKNLKTANKEIAWGTSLEREFLIATTKTSAQLQLLSNRADAAKRTLGEDLAPTLVRLKKVTVGATEAFSDFVHVLKGTSKESKENVLIIDAYIEAIERENEERKKTPKFLNNVAWGLKYVGDVTISTAKDTEFGLKKAREWRTEQYEMGRSAIENAHKMESWNQSIENQAMISSITRTALSGLYDTADNMGMITAENMPNMVKYNAFLEDQRDTIKKINTQIDDEATKTQMINDLKMIEARYRQDAVKEVIAEFNGKEHLLDLNEAENIKTIKKGYDRTNKSREEGLIIIEDIVIVTAKWEKIENELADAIENASKALKIEDWKKYDALMKSAWSTSKNYVSSLREQGDAQIEYEAATKRMPSYMRKAIAPYKKRIDEAEELAQLGKDEEAQAILTSVAEEVAARRIESSSRQEQKGLGNVLKLIDMQMNAYGLLPDEIENVKKMLDDIEAAYKIELGIDTTGLEEAIKRIEEREIIEIRVIGKSIKEETEGSYQFGGKVLKSGIYKLHENERVLNAQETKRYEIDKHSEDRSLHVSMNGITLSEGYSAKRLLEDIEMYSLSRI